MERKGKSNASDSETRLWNFRDLFSTNKYPDTDFTDRMFRLAITIFFMAFVSGLIAGIISPISDMKMNFGSPKSIGLMTILFISFWLLFSSIGPYKNR